MLQDYLVVYSKSSSKVVLFNAIDGKFIHVIENEGFPVKVHFLVFGTKALLAIVRNLDNKVRVNFLHIGEGTVHDDSSDETHLIEASNFLDGWYRTEGTSIDIPITSPVVACKVSDSKNYLVMACKDGTMSYLIDDGDDNDDEKMNSTTSIIHKDLSCIQRTVSTDYAPVHAISLLRVSVLEGLLACIVCTKHMLVLYHMIDGSPIIRIRKHYDDATCTGKGKFIIACSKGIIDMFVLKMLLTETGVAHYATIDAHSRPIRQLGILSFGN